ncbi:MAG: FtsH protease activity modulator HflK [Alphaproteobacteria bacterium]|nr:FtsH protease activity modulator HflK [Alphaproteobacteria bacterium]
MPWNNQGGGGSPWGSGGGSGGGGRGQGPWGGGGGPRPPDFEDLLRRGQDKLRGIIPGGVGSSRGIILVLLIAVAIWLASGFYRVQPDEQGVVLRFGALHSTTPPGLNYHLPVPFESALTPSVTRVNRVDVGFRSSAATSTGAGSRDVPEEGLMLTGDENIIDVKYTVFWVINDAGKFLFNIRNPEQTVRAAAESAMREIVGRSAIQREEERILSGDPAPKAAVAGIMIRDILERGRREVEQETEKLLQRTLDTYGAGIKITQVQMQNVEPPAQVIDAFRDVQRAEADKERLRNEAQGYSNDIIPRARGEAARIIQEAEGYKRQTVAKAQGDSSRFKALYEQYRNAPRVTRQRLYLETMEEVLAKNSKIVIDRSQGGPGVVPYLPLPELQKRQAAPAQGGAK